MLPRNLTSITHGLNLNARIVRNKYSNATLSVLEAAKSLKAIKLEINADDRVATMTLDHMKVNFLDRVSMSEFNRTIKLLGETSEIRGLIIASANPKVFSAGLNLFEMYNTTPKDLTEFWSLFQDTCIAMNTARFFTACAISGSAPAGGCVLSMWSDIRVLVDRPDVNIGLNETDFGLKIPEFVIQTAINTVGPKNAQRMAVQGELFDAKTALRIGLVDDILECSSSLSQDNLNAINLAKNKLSVLVAGSDARFNCKIDTKLAFTNKFADYVKHTRAEDMQAFHEAVLSETTQKALEKYISQLQSRKKSIN